MSKCPIFEDEAIGSKTINLKYIQEMSQLLRQDIENQSWCYKVIRNRIYGSLQMTEEVLNMAPVWIKFFEEMNNNLSVRTGVGG